jgi:DNA polymerase-3 subunit epsilon
VIRFRPERRSWREVSFGALDFETTGLDLRRDHVVSFGFVPIEGGRVAVSEGLYRVVRPPIPVPAEAIRVHGITPDQLADAQTFDQVAGELRGALDGRVLVAHAAWIELALLDRLFPDLPRRRRSRAIDVLELAAREPAAGVDSARLSDLAASYGVPAARTHHAFGDALMTAQLFVVLASRLEARGRGRLSDLLAAGRPQIARSFAGRGLDRTRPIS